MDIEQNLADYLAHNDALVMRGTRQTACIA